MKVRVISAVIIAISLVAGCAQQAWVYDGKRYTDSAQLKRDMDSNFSTQLANIKPLPHPLTKRELKVIIPDRSWLFDAKLEYIKVGVPLATRDMIANDVLLNTTYDENARLSDLIRKKNIFPNVSQSTVVGPVEIQPSDDYDALVFSTALKPPGVDQLYYISKRNGKQIITFDQNLVSIQERIESQLNSIKAAAIQ
ncbi:hypothetical protein [Azospirillum sp. B2RO_4]|uniref:hypothetical protein n=1 Tax=Azospirillum sp. B2RO_4 TaxID=3027796 RepID=UPI003DA99B40